MHTRMCTQTHTHTHRVLRKVGMSEDGLALLNSGTISHNSVTVSSLAVHTVCVNWTGGFVDSTSRLHFTSDIIYMPMYVLCVCVCVWAQVQAHACVVQDKKVNNEQENKGNYITNQNYQEITLIWRDQYKYSTTLITSVHSYENEIMSTQQRRITKTRHVLLYPSSALQIHFRRLPFTTSPQNHKLLLLLLLWRLPPPQQQQ